MSSVRHHVKVVAPDEHVVVLVERVDCRLVREVGEANWGGGVAYGGMNALSCVTSKGSASCPNTALGGSRVWVSQSKWCHFSVVAY